MEKRSNDEAKGMGAGQIIIATGKRKTAVARAYVKPGMGRIWVNGTPLELWPIEVARLKMMEPLLVAGDVVRNVVDVDVQVKGGGFMGQAEAVRMAIARGLVDYFSKCVPDQSPELCQWSRAVAEKLKALYEEYDRTMLAGDPRRTEPEKYMRYSARRKWQTSYR
ncbi:MAG: 30S ribosomal protein S9 [Acidilobus sp.]